MAVLYFIKYNLSRCFLQDGTVKFYNDKATPLEAHAFAHAVICLCDMAVTAGQELGQPQRIK